MNKYQLGPSGKRKSIRSSYLYWEKKSKKKEYKMGAGLGTTISGKKVEELDSRFREENKDVLLEAEREWAEIRKKRSRRAFFIRRIKGSSE